MKKLSKIAILIVSYFSIGCATVYTPAEDDILYAFVDMNIPYGHLPPVGECKVWFPDRPAGQQPPPQSCSSAIMNRPEGTWIITHETNRFRVVSFITTKNGIVEKIKYFRKQ